MADLGALIEHCPCCRWEIVTTVQVNDSTPFAAVDNDPWDALHGALMMLHDEEVGEADITIRLKKRHKEVSRG